MVLKFKYRAGPFISFQRGIRTISVEGRDWKKGLGIMKYHKIIISFLYHDVIISYDIYIIIITILFVIPTSIILT